MRLILDTHIVLWLLVDAEALRSARSLLLDPENDKFVSVVSLWEIAIKYRLCRGRLDDMPLDAATAYGMIEEAGLHILPVTAAHAVSVGTLPLEGHADPFDRVLVAQAAAESMRLVTRDAKLAGYGEHVLLI